MKLVTRPRLRIVGSFAVALGAFVEEVPARPTIGGARSQSAALKAPPVRRGGEVRIVAQGGGGDFTAIQPAVDAAVDGDTILVKSGSYASFTIDGKSLHVVEDTGAIAFAGCTVKNLPSGSTATVIGLTGHNVTLTDNAGRVRIESCWLTPGAVEMGPSIVASNCADVAIARSQITGSPGDVLAGPTHLNGAHAISASSSVLTLYYTNATGGMGAIAEDAGDGGRGLSQTSTSLFAAGCTIKGGHGGESSECTSESFGGNGGAGLVGPVGSIGFQNVLTGGAGAFGCEAGGSNGAAGSFTTMLTGNARRMSLASPVRDQSVVPISFTGQAGDFVVLYISRGTARTYDVNLRGVLMVEAPYFAVLAMGVVPPSGTLNATIVVKDSWTSPNTASVYYAQAVFTDTLSTYTLSDPTTLVVLDHVY